MEAFLSHSDATEYAKTLPSNSVDLYILDPPFGIGEVAFTGAKGAGSSSSNTILGYQEAPDDYASFCRSWLQEVYRTLKTTGTCYIISGWSYQLGHLMVECEKVGFHLLNHCIWHYNTYVIPTQKKFSSSHYHVLRLGKRKDGQTFSVPDGSCIDDWCTMPAGRGGKLETYDKMDVWTIPREHNVGTKKNLNKLPDALVSKIISYSSNEGDLICDLFMGNFTTAYCALNLKRRVCGCEINSETYNHHLPLLTSKYHSQLKS